MKARLATLHRSVPKSTLLRSVANRGSCLRHLPQLTEPIRQRPAGSRAGPPCRGNGSADRSATGSWSGTPRRACCTSRIAARIVWATSRKRAWITDALSLGATPRKSQTSAKCRGCSGSSREQLERGVVRERLDDAVVIRLGRPGGDLGSQPRLLADAGRLGAAQRSEPIVSSAAPSASAPCAGGSAASCP